MTTDKGGCGLGHATKNAIVVSHWGLVGSWVLMQPKRRGGDESLMLEDEAALLEAMRENEWCHNPAKDLVVPTYWKAKAVRDAEARERSDERGFDPLLLFAGDLRPHDPAYSGGMRQAIARAAANASAIEPAADGLPPPPFTILRYAHDREWRRAKFCLAVSGDGWGNRLMKSFLLNCVPAIAAPLVVQPFETLLNFDELSVRVDERRLTSLAARLHAVPNRTVDRTRRRLARVRDAFAWDRGGLAYNATLLALCHRAVELRGGLVGQPRAGEAACAPLAAGIPGTSARAREPHWFSAQLKSAMRTVQAERRAAMAGA